jgi:hypothetical protein
MTPEAQTVAELEKKLARMERDWQSMIRITHDFFHSWREAVEERLGKQAADEVQMRFWEIVGVGTGKLYLERGGNPEDPEQIAYTMLRASQVMGETAHTAREGDASLLVHEACPWLDSFRERGAAGQCQAGCDNWFQATVRTISPRLQVVTESALPAGDATCTRRFSRKAQ